MILKRRMQMENNVKHFTLGPSDENTYGWPWNEVVKRYLESGYAGDQKEFQGEIRGKEYKILKRDAVTVFYDEAGNTLFDVTNDRLEKEYNSLTSAAEEEQESGGPESSVGKAIEAIDRGTLDAAASEEDKNTEGDDFVPMGKASLADIMTGNIPDPTPEEVETAKKANAGDVLAKAKQKLEEELKRDTYKKQYWKMLRSTISILIVVAAIVVLISNLFLPILRIYGGSWDGRRCCAST